MNGSTYVITHGVMSSMRYPGVSTLAMDAGPVA